MWWNLRWVKLHVGVIDNDLFKRLSANARYTFLYGLAIAGKCDLGGALALRVGPMTVDEIRTYTGLDRAPQEAALKALVQAGFVAFEDGSYRIERWSEKAGDYSTLRAKASKGRKFGEAGAALQQSKNVPEQNGSKITLLHGTKSNITEEEEEIEVEIEEEREARKRVRPTAEKVDFGKHESAVSQFLALTAAENKTGTMAQSRVDGMRFGFWSALEEYGEAIWIRALLESVKKNKCRSLGYFTAIANRLRDDGFQAVVKPEVKSSYQPITAEYLAAGGSLE